MTYKRGKAKRSRKTKRRKNRDPIDFERGLSKYQRMEHWRDRNRQSNLPATGDRW